MSADDARTDQIRARLEAATPGPWAYWGQGWIAPEHDPQCDSCGVPQNLIPRTDADAEFIAHAPADIAHLLAENKRLRADRDEQGRYLSVAVEQAQVSGYTVADALAALLHLTKLRAERDRLIAQVQRIEAQIQYEAGHGSAITRCNLVAERFRAAIDGEG